MFGGSDKLAMVGPTVRLFGYSHFAALAFYAIQCALYADHRLRAGAQIAPFFLTLYIFVVYSATLLRPRMFAPLFSINFPFILFIVQDQTMFPFCSFFGQYGVDTFPWCPQSCAFFIGPSPLPNHSSTSNCHSFHVWALSPIIFL
jgi:hypothetical protein